MVDVRKNNFNEKFRASLAAIGAGEASPDVDVAFAVDRSIEGNGGGALEWAMAANRSSFSAGERFALVSCGQARGTLSPRVETPFATDPYLVERAAAKTRWWDARGTSFAVRWAALDQAARLEWRRNAKRHIVLITDDRGDGASVPTPATFDPAIAASVATWAHDSGASLHILRYSVPSSPDPGGTQEESGILPPPGPPVAEVAGLFRNAAHAKADAAAVLTKALQDALAAAGPVDAVLIVDRAGLMGQSLRSLRTARPVLDAFTAVSGHRLALVEWSADKAATTVRSFAAPPTAVPNAFAQISRDPSAETWGDLFAALDLARRLPWNPVAAKVVVVFTATSPVGSDLHNPVLDWLDSAGVNLTFIEPTDALTATAKAGR